VKRSRLAATDPAAARNLNEWRILSLLLRAPELLELNIEPLARLDFHAQQLDRVRSELLNLAGSHERLETAAIENHLVSRGLGVVAERLKSDSRVLAGIDERSDAGNRQALFDRMRAQLENADSSRVGQLQERRARVLEEFIQHGTGEHQDELQRLKNEILARTERSGDGI
jgi:hypothetical protein